MDYWPGLVAMFFCPFCTICYTNACTELNPKLGGQKVNTFMSALCTWACAPCVIAQDAESLDEATQMETGFCGAQSLLPFDMHAGMQPGMMMAPGGMPGAAYPGGPAVMAPGMYGGPGPLPGQQRMFFR